MLERIGSYCLLFFFLGETNGLRETPNPTSLPPVAEDEVDQILSGVEGKLHRKRDEKL